MPRANRARCMAITMPPLWPTIAAGPRSSSVMRSSGMVMRRLAAARLPMQLCTEFAAHGIATFAEAAGEHRGAARLGAACFHDGVDGRLARYDHDHMVGRFRQACEASIAGLPVPHRLVAGIDRVDGAREVEAFERVIDALRPVAGPVAGAHDGNIARR